MVSTQKALPDCDEIREVLRPIRPRSANKSRMSLDAKTMQGTHESPPKRALQRRTSAPALLMQRKQLGIDDFELMHLIGQGGVGKVWYAVKKDSGQEFAVKIIDKHQIIGSSSVGRVLAEREIMTRLEHPFVISLHFAFQDDTRIFFVLDYLRGGDFFRLMKKIPNKKIPEHAARFYAAELVLAISYLHTNNICFRDLKPENILVSDTGHLCVTDFGLAVLKQPKTKTTHKTVCGTPE